MVPRALGDIVRLRDFVASVNPPAASRIALRLKAVSARLKEQPRMGQALDADDAREVRRLFEGPYEVRYEIFGETIYILRVWHGREDR